MLISIALQAFSILPVPLQINKVFYYFLFFYGGGMFYRHSAEIGKRATAISTTLMWILFIVMVVGANMFMEKNDATRELTDSLIGKLFCLEMNTYLKSALAVVGITAFYQTAVLYCKSHSIGKFMLKVGTCGYGVYVFHQFILVHLYRQTDLPVLCGTYWLPWVALGLTVIVSVLLTLLVRTTALGRKFL